MSPVHAQSPEWTKVRESVLLRDNHQCVECGVRCDRKQIAELAVKLPAISWSGEFAKAGLRMSYGPDVHAMAHRAASFVDKVLKGTHPSAIPIEQPTKFELVVNVTTARALGLEIQPTLLARADEVIE